ncbi:unnamed protein product [Nippostrongylus brasiliensis]|uniref:Uncharacterized protein n=1 Tax=Nippostrongylus brasiliensis TaxID=27835 RepID=A0A0N4Y8G2_NIPBR|nr:unnamed protein product [Nippostrongylus brasiliensis]
MGDPVASEAREAWTNSKVGSSCEEDPAAILVHSRGVVHCSLLSDEQAITADLFIEDVLEVEHKLLEKY